MQAWAFFHSHMRDFKQRDISETFIFRYGLYCRTKNVSFWPYNRNPWFDFETSKQLDYQIWNKVIIILNEILHEFRIYRASQKAAFLSFFHTFSCITCGPLFFKFWLFKNEITLQNFQNQYRFDRCIFIWFFFYMKIRPGRA